MKLGTILKTLVLALCISFLMPVQSKALNAAAVITTVVNDTTGSAEVYSKLVTRLSEIESMDKSNLGPEEKRSLRNELKDMKKAADGLNSKVYLSVGAIIIIILLLILILR